MNKKFPEYENLNLPSIAKEILSRWEEEDVFNKSVAIREGKAPFVFYEGPPSANGMPGIHHVMSRTIKDLFCRYKTLKGFQVKRKAGWDTHGLPVELAVEKELGITKEDIGNPKEKGGITVEEYNQACRKEVMKYKDKWEELTRIMGYWVDMKNPYVTYDNDYIESVWWLLKQLYDKKLLYQRFTIQPYSPAAGSGLSSHELNQPGCYKNVKDSTAVAMFKMIDNEKRKELFSKLDIRKENVKVENFYFLAWTTTPWTLPSNTALAIGKDIKYDLVATINKFSKEVCVVVIAENLFSKYFQSTTPPVSELSEDQSDELNRMFKDDPIGLLHKLKEIGFHEWKGKNDFGLKIRTIPGSMLEGMSYEQLLQFPKIRIKNEKAFKVYCGDFVSTEDGTGIVHIAPTFGSDDFNLAMKNDIPPVVVKRLNGLLDVPLVDLKGKFVEEIKDEVFGFAGEYVKEAYLTDKEKETELNIQKTKLKKSNGGYIEDTTNLKYQSVDERLIKKLELEGKLFHKEKYEHNYPHCWRTDKPIIYYPLNAWFVKVTEMKDRMVELNKTIRWKPEHTGTGRFGEWLHNLQDWNLSRSRYWGIPLPVWRNDQARWNIKRIEKCVGSFEELENHPNAYFLTNKLKNPAFTESLTGLSISIFRTFFEKKHPNLKFEDLFFNEVENKTILPLSEVDFSNFDFHRPNIDNIIFFEEGEILARELDLIDVWFDSGSMPYAQWHYPFENKEEFKKSFPADFIAEGVDQTRGWFYTLHAIAVMLFDSVAYKTVVSNGLVLDKNGQKMSKRLGNVVDPFETIGKFGADATRWYLITNSQPWENLKFDMEGIAEVQKKFFRALYNTYAFFALYANIDSFRHAEKEIPVSERPEMDRWILSELNDLIKSVDSCYEKYEPTAAGRLIEKFVVDKLSNWYVRLNRRRFWKGEQGTDKTAAYQTLYKCLEAVAQLASPIAPFYCEKLYTDLKSAIANQQSTINSVHLSDFPECDETLININLQEKMEIAQALSSLVLSLRKKEKIRVRQPLQKMLIPGINADFVKKLEAVKDLILSEVNVKQLEIISVNTEVLIKTIKPNFKILGPKYGKLMKEISEAVSKFTQEDISALESAGIYRLPVNGEKIDLQITDFEILSQSRGLGPGWRVASEGRFTVALDVTISEQLKEEGIAREIVNKIQNIRKDKGFEVTDKILLKIQSNKLIDSAIYNNLNYICSETLASSLNLVEKIPHKDAAMVEVEEGVETLISIEKLN